MRGSSDEQFCDRCAFVCAPNAYSLAYAYTGYSYLALFDGSGSQAHNHNLKLLAFNILMRWSGQFLQFVQCSAHPVLHAVGHIDIFAQVCGVASAAEAGGHVDVVREVICSRAPFGCA